MAFMDSLNIVGSALTAERFRMNIVLQNIANQNTTRTEDGGPYRRKQVVFETREQSFSEILDKAQNGGLRVKEVVENENEFIPVYDPNHPDANEEGYVFYPNVNNAEEQVDLMEASRAYEANVSALSVVKAMATKALEIGR